MYDWWRNLDYAAAGIAAGALVELLTGARRTRSESLLHCLSAGGIAVAYANLVPPSIWGATSAARFAHLPVIASLSGVTMNQTARLSLAGLLLRWTRSENWP